jgi:hypothetical protein
VPVWIQCVTIRWFSRIAISPEFEIPNSVAFRSPNGRDSRLPGRVMKISNGCPFHAAA